MTVRELVMQMYLTFGDSVVGQYSDNALYDQALSPAPPDAGIGNIHEWYPLNKSHVNGLQELNLQKSRLKIPFMHVGEWLHGVGSFKQSMFPQTIGLAATWDVDLVHRDQRWGRCQEDWGEDHTLTSHMGVAYASGLSHNSTRDANDAVVPVMKHFAAHGAPQGGLNAAPFMGHGNRQVLQRLLVPFKAATDLGGVRGVMMAYNELDDIPAPVNPILYDALESWGYDGFVVADDTAMFELQTWHQVASSPADAISQWFNAGGMISYYDYPLETYMNSTVDLVANHSVSLDLLKEKVRKILAVKYDLGLFEDPFIPESIDPHRLVEGHVKLTLEAARKSIVMLENRNHTLPLDPHDVGKLAVIGLFGDMLNYSAYSSADVVSAMGANTWLYNAQYPIPGYHLSTMNGTPGGLSATYYADTSFSQPLVHKIEVPVGDWGLYPPDGLPSNNFSVIWEDYLDVPSGVETGGWLGVAIGLNTTARLYVDDVLVLDVPLTTIGNILSNIPVRAFTLVNSTAPHPGSTNFTFRPGAKHKIKIEYQTWNLYHKIENESTLNSEILFFWNLVDRSSPIEKAVSVAQDADVVVLALDAIFALGKPVVMVLQGGRPFAIPDYYNASSAVLDVFFGGQSAGQAIADVLFGAFNPGGRTTLTVPRHVGQMPVYYNYKGTEHAANWVDTDATPAYPFGYGLSYSNFSVSDFRAAAGSNTTAADRTMTFSVNSTIVFEVTVRNSGALAGSHVPQVYLLQRVSRISQPVLQLVAFARVHLAVGETQVVSMELEVDRYLKILNRRYEWEVEKGDYTFAIMENGGIFADMGMKIRG
ncbi:glycoside hydrolase [Teratosphaeria nubilosa]|uniref:xylan 1,4-beta-xylosidase n=1 Tax=Teratosphaeria nubilosa TaxID=161662 RepID=A0A6G1KUK0_9PEZI|nr:glycoside hydrolase [Teratosphaeria nubilosa]